MKLVQPSVTLWKQGEDPIAHVAKCARVCYGKEKGNDSATYNRLIKSNHISMFRHESVYIIMPLKHCHNELLVILSKSPFVESIAHNNTLYVSTNYNFILDLDEEYRLLLLQYRVGELEFENNQYGFSLMRYTFCITTQISTSRELNRVSPNNIAEQSTRYVYEEGALCIPFWLTQKDIEEFNNAEGNFDFLISANMSSSVFSYLISCDESFNTYKQLIDVHGLTKEEARGVLPLDTATKCVYTYSVNEWKHILDLRYYGKTGKPHPNAKIIAGMIRNELLDLGYEV